ncbi:HAD family hydrolase [Clostridium sp. CF012]|uniref:HAD family hydrolase n=1 Tax=Clostridium sp. CF012 TaxID=2843319 RepID=UPI001C0D7C33|nr:HAD family hydrolase [Clostridium sp. CF012]MBU3142695.1 HAD family hydrolase [Clostridium sp. CF012]
MNKIIFWDFHGTLAHNDWMFSKALHKVLISCEPNSNIGIEDFKKKPMIGFPWQDCDKAYIHLIDGNAWWKHAESIFINCYKGFNIIEEKAIQYAGQVRAEFIKADEFILYEDTIEMLNYFKEKGYSNIILSNHIPELPRIVEDLGLSSYLIDCISSANVGYEKPNAKIYEHALEKYNNPKEVWMVGDSLAADVKGPENFGIKGVLVRSKMEDGIRYYSKNLLGLREIIKE